MAAKKFYRTSGNDKKIAGVCGGLSEYFDVDVTLVRALFLCFAFAGGWGGILYLVLWVCAPKKPE